jgi:hypothetical protein
MLGRLLSIAPAALRSPYGNAVPSVQSVSVERKQSFDLAIQTAEGDVATVRIARQQSYNAQTQVSISDRGRALSLRASSSDSLNAVVSVQGDLNAQETASINALVQKVNGVADDFFAGDMEQAIAGAAGIEMQGSSLSAFAFDLQSQEVRRAAAVYENIATTTAPLAVAPAKTTSATASTPAAPSPSWLQSLRALFDGLTRNAQSLAQAPLQAAPNAAANDPRLVIDV